MNPGMKRGVWVITRLAILLALLAGCSPTPAAPARTLSGATTPPGSAAPSRVFSPVGPSNTPPGRAATPTAKLFSLPSVTPSPGAPATASPAAKNAVCPAQTVPPASPDKLALSLPADARFNQYSLVEFNLATSVSVKNPFDPAQMDLVVHYTVPDGKVLTIPAFWYQDFDPTGTVPCGEPGWKARLTPTLPGKWTAQAEMRNLKIKSAAVIFQVSPTDARGFVRVSPKNPHYLAFDNGQTYFPIGINMGWWNTDPLTDYQNWMDKLHANGGSLIRVWMANWAFGIEWQDTGLGDYSKREKQAWLLDQVFRMASQRDINIDLVLIEHGAFSETTNAQWDSNPYNAANGGPCKTPECFATDPAARQMFQRRVRYIAARWGYSPNLLAWEWWNEEDFTPITENELAPWIKEMSATLRSYDPYQHLITTSFNSKNSQKVLSLPEISFTQVHLYDFSDPTSSFTDIYQSMRSLTPSKPVVFGEFGFSNASENSKSYDKDGTHLHNGLWTATFLGFASPAMYWWWDTYVDPLNLWGQFGSLSQFLKGSDLATLTPGKAIPEPSQAIALPTLLARAYTLQNSSSALVWVKNNRYEAAVTKAMLGDPIHGLALSVTGLKDGNYQVAWYDPTSQKWSDGVPTAARNCQLTLVVPDFLKDMAARITPAK